MELIRKVTLMIIIIIISTALIYIFLKTKHTTIDRYYIFSELLLGFFLAFGMLFNIDIIIEICHIIYATLMLLGVLLIVNKNILTIILTLILLQKLLRIILGECILNVSKLTLNEKIFGDYIIRNIEMIEFIPIGIILYKLSMN